MNVSILARSSSIRRPITRRGICGEFTFYLPAVRTFLAGTYLVKTSPAQNLITTVLKDTNLSHANLADVQFGGNIFGGIVSAEFTNTDFSYANVTGASFEYATTRGFIAEQLYSTESYQSKNLHGIGLHNNDLDGWDFSGQNLSNVNFGNSTLDRTVLAGANLKNAVFDGVDLATAVFDSATIYNQWTWFPDSFDPARAGLTFVESPAGDFHPDEMLDSRDIDLLMWYFRGDLGAADGGYLRDDIDLNGDTLFDEGDLRHWVHGVKQSWFGDANLDGEFNSGDLVQVLSVGKYEAAEVDCQGNAIWSV